MFVSSEVSKQRYSICKGCDKFNKWLQQCKSCGCIIPAKVKLSYASCPEGKWDSENKVSSWGSFNGQGD